MSKHFSLSIWLLALMMSAQFALAQTPEYPPQLEYYPIIFLHGHGQNFDIENNWDYIVLNKLTDTGYTYQGKIHEQSSYDLPTNIMDWKIWTMV